jgi:hypothetical protein
MGRKGGEKEGEEEIDEGNSDKANVITMVTSQERRYHSDRYLRASQLIDSALDDPAKASSPRRALPLKRKASRAG